jgi:hypothetical protein
MVEIKLRIPKYILQHSPAARVADRIGQAVQSSVSATARNARDSLLLFTSKDKAAIAAARNNILRSNYRFALTALVYDTGREYGFDQRRITRMIRRMRKLSLQEDKEMLKAIPAAMAAGLNPESITILYELVMRRNLGEAEKIFSEFPAVFDTASKVGLTGDETKSLIISIVDRFGSVITDDALFALSALLIAGYREEKILKLFQKLTMHVKAFAEKGFRSLPGLFEAGLTATQVVDWLVSCEANRKKLLPIEYCITSLNALYLLRGGEDIETVAAANSELLSELKEESHRTHKKGEPTVGGKIGGSTEDFNYNIFELLLFVGIKTRKEILGNLYSNHDLILLPAARSAAEAILLIDLLKAVGLFKNGYNYRHQVTLSGRIREDAKYIALSLHAAQFIRPEFPPQVPEIGGYENVAPVAEGGGNLFDVRGTKSLSKERFDIPLLCILQIGDLREVFIDAQKKKTNERTVIEENLLAFYDQIKERCHKELEIDLDNDPYGYLGAQVFNAFEESMEPFIDVWENNHHLTIETAAFLTWAMQAEPGTPQSRIFSDFKRQMQHIFGRHGLEDVLKTPWVNRKWAEIYPDLYRFEQAERYDPSFADKIRDSVNAVDQLKQLYQ